MLDPVIIGGAVVGLAMGSFGYVLLRFVARPVLGYRRLKKRLADALAATRRPSALPQETRDALRRMAMALQELVDEGLPAWYALALQRKGEQPKEAVRHLQALVNCREAAAIQRRTAAVAEALRLPPAQPR